MILKTETVAKYKDEVSILENNADALGQKISCSKFWIIFRESLPLFMLEWL